MWESGATRGEIAMAFGLKPASVSARIAVMRRRGYPVSYRRPDMIEHGRGLREHRSAA